MFILIIRLYAHMSANTFNCVFCEKFELSIVNSSENIISQLNILIIL